MKYAKQSWPLFLLRVWGAIIGGFLLIYIFLNLAEAVKWFGTPFLLLPDALGLIERAHADETHEFSTNTRQSYPLALEKPGPYLIFLDAQGAFIMESDVTLTLSGPDGRVPIAPAGRGVKPYDTPWLKGFPGFRFTINEPGSYQLTIQPNLARQTVIIGIAPDYASGKTTLHAWAINLQIGLIVILVGFVYYRRYYLPGAEREETIALEQVKRRGDFEEFLEEFKREPPKR